MQNSLIIDISNAHGGSGLRGPCHVRLRVGYSYQSRGHPSIRRMPPRESAGSVAASLAAPGREGTAHWARSAPRSSRSSLRKTGGGPLSRPPSTAWAKRTLRQRGAGFLVSATRWSQPVLPRRRPAGWSPASDVRRGDPYNWKREKEKAPRLCLLPTTLDLRSGETTR